MKKGLLVLVMLALVASAWAEMPSLGGTVKWLPLLSGGGSYNPIPVDTLQYHSIFTDNYVNIWNPPQLFTATRFTPPYTGTVDTAYVFLFVNAAFTATDTLFFYNDTTISAEQPGRVLAEYPWTTAYPSRNAWGIKLSLGTAYNMTSGTDFWAGIFGFLPATGESIRMVTDTSTSTVQTRQWVKFNGTWYQASSVGVTKDWGISLFVHSASGVEVLTPGGAVSLPPRLYPASPNPFRGSGEIAFDLPKSSQVELTIHDLAGRLVRTLASGENTAGHHAVRWDGKDALGNPVASGVYLYTLRAGALYATRSLVVVR